MSDLTDSGIMKAKLNTNDAPLALCTHCTSTIVHKLLNTEVCRGVNAEHPLFVQSLLQRIWSDNISSKITILVGNLRMTSQYDDYHSQSNIKAAYARRSIDQKLPGKTELLPVDSLPQSMFMTQRVMRHLHVNSMRHSTYTALIDCL